LAPRRRDTAPAMNLRRFWAPARPGPHQGAAPARCPDRTDRHPRPGFRALL